MGGGGYISTCGAPSFSHSLIFFFIIGSFNAFKNQLLGGVYKPNFVKRKTHTPLQPLQPLQPLPPMLPPTTSLEHADTDTFFRRCGLCQNYLYGVRPLPSKQLVFEAYLNTSRSLALGSLQVSREPLNKDMDSDNSCDESKYYVGGKRGHLTGQMPWAVQPQCLPSLPKLSMVHSPLSLRFFSIDNTGSCQGIHVPKAVFNSS